MAQVKQNADTERVNGSGDGQHPPRPNGDATVDASNTEGRADGVADSGMLAVQPIMPRCQPADLFPEVTAILQQISHRRQRPLFGLISQFIGPDIPREVFRWRRQLQEAGKRNDLDILIHSPGGDLTSCYRTARLFARYTDCWQALVPEIAASGATLICLGSSNIVLSDIAQLGPVDPQVLSKRPGRFFLVERQSPLEAFQAVRYVHKLALSTLDSSMLYLIGEQGVNPQVAVESATKLAVDLARPILEKIEPFDLGAFDLDSTLALDYCRRICEPPEAKKQTQRDAKYRALVERYPAHEFFIDSSEAAQLGFQAVRSPEDLETLFEQLRPHLQTLNTYVGLVPND